MLHNLQFDVTFPSGKRFNQNINFAKGHTAITGLNGKGKSLIPEMIQYAYWGTKALRGMADDYKKLSVKHTFEIKGQEYTVERGKSVTLFAGQTPIATGTKPVNAKIEDLFGYSYDVFTMANACNQGKVEQLGDMGPTDRKKLVDKVVGLDALDDLVKYISKEESNLRASITAVESVLTEPVAPEAPENYRTPDEIKKDLTALDVIQKKYNRLKASAEVVLREPTAPQAPHDLDKLEEYIENSRQRDLLVAERNATLAQIQGIPDATMTQEEITAAEESHRGYDDWSTKKALKTSLMTKRVRHECPACQHEWHDQDPRLVDLTDVADSMEAPKVPKSVISAQKVALAKAEVKQQGGEKLIEVMGKIEALPESQQPRIQAINLYKNNLAVYKAELAGYSAAVTLRDEALAGLQDPSFAQLEQIAPLSDLLLKCSVFDAQFASYQKALTTYHGNLQKVLDMKAEADQWSAAKKAVADLRTRVKAYLLPSLNKVGSILINDMTGGELSWVTVNEDFDITVEGQRLETLSGAGKSVANLALRIALGSVLTNKVFSVLLLDEIDAACDENRAGFIAACVRRLTKQISQVVQISHKQIEADHYVKL